MLLPFACATCTVGFVPFLRETIKGSSLRTRPGLVIDFSALYFTGSPSLFNKMNVILPSIITISSNLFHLCTWKSQLYQILQGVMTKYKSCYTFLCINTLLFASADPV